MAASTSLKAKLTDALCSPDRQAEMVAILNAATHATISLSLRRHVYSTFEGAGEEVITMLTVAGAAPSKELNLKAASALGLQASEFLTLLAAVA